MARNRPVWAEEIFLEIRALGVGMEEMRDDIKLMAEQHVDIRRDIAEVKEEVVAIREVLDTKTDAKETVALERRVAVLEKNRK